MNANCAMINTLASCRRPQVRTRRVRCFGGTIITETLTPTTIRGTLAYFGQGIDVGQYAEVSESPFCRMYVSHGLHDRW